MGTLHEPHVTPGLKRWTTAEGTSRWAKTARRMGSTAYVSGFTRVSTTRRGGRLLCGTDRLPSGRAGAASC
jgi:hypothetical protein